MGILVLFVPGAFAASEAPYAGSPGRPVTDALSVARATTEPTILAAAPTRPSDGFDRWGSWYAGLHAAGIVVPDTLFSGGAGGNVDFDTGFALGGSIGYAYDFGLRIESEVTYRVSQAKRLVINGTPLSGSGNLETLNAMLNGWFDITFLSAVLGDWVPYFGGGAGISHAWIDVGSIGFPIIEAQDTAFAWQGGGGLAYRISQGLFISLDYRFFHTLDDFSFDDASFSAPIKAEYKIHSITLGIRGHF